MSLGRILTQPSVVASGLPGVSTISKKRYQKSAIKKALSKKRYQKSGQKERAARYALSSGPLCFTIYEPIFAICASESWATPLGSGWKFT